MNNKTNTGSLLRGTSKLLLPFVFSLFFSPCFGQYTISTIAGGGSQEGVSATNAMLYDPQGLAIDRAGNMYITDGTKNKVKKVTPAGIFSTIAGNGGIWPPGDGGNATAASVNDPTVIATDSAGNIYFAESNKIRKISTDGIISTVVGNGSWGFSGDGGAATSALISGAAGIAVDNSGNIFFSDAYNNRIRRVTPTGIITTIAGDGTAFFSGDGGAATLAKVNSPGCIAFDKHGNLYFADRNNYRIRKITTDGIISTCAGNGSYGIGGDGGAATSASVGDVRGISLDTFDNFYLSEGYKVRKITSSGVISTVAGPVSWNYGYSGDGGAATGAIFMTIFAIATDATGNIYVADNNRIRKVSLAGTISTIVGGGSGDGNLAYSASLWNPRGVTLDSLGNLYIADGRNNRIRKVTGSGVISTIAGDGTGLYNGDGIAASSAQLNNPSCVAIDASHNIFIADVGNHRIRKISPTGTISTVAGGMQGYAGDGGAATAAALNYPSGVALDNSGNIFIADWGNNRIRKVTPSGVISTVAGNGTDGYSGDGGAATAASLNLPSSVSVDRNGNIFITGGSNRIRKVTPTGIINTVAGGGSGGDGSYATDAYLNSPSSMAIDSAGNMYIGESNRIRKISSSGIISTIAGSSYNGFSGDGGPATDAKIYNALGIAVDKKGIVYFADFNNDRIRVLLPVVTGTTNLCVGTNTTLNNAITGGTWSSSNTSIATVNNSSGVVTAISGGTVNITYSLGICYATSVITVDSMYYPSAITGTTTVCAGANATLNNAVSGGVWSSSSPGVAIVSYGLVSGNTAGTSLISYTLTNSCGIRAATTMVTVNATPLISGPSVACIGTPITLSSSNDGGSWSSSNSSIALVSGAGLVTGVTTGVSTITYTDSNGCYKTTSVSVNTYPAAITGDSQGCSGNHIYLTDVTIGGTWSSLNTTVASLAAWTTTTGIFYLYQGTAVIKYTKYGCAVTKTITANMNPLELNQITGPNAVCKGATITLSNSISGGKWKSASINLATVDSNLGVVRGISSGYNSISYTIPSGCYYAKYVNIDSLADIDIYHQLPSTVCNNSSIYCYATSGTYGNAWQSSNPAIFGIGWDFGYWCSVVFRTAGVGTISHSVTNSCGNSTASKTITVNATPVISGPQYICVGNTITLTNTATGGRWVCNNTSIATIDSITGVCRGISTGYANIIYNSGNGCSTSNNYRVYVNNAAPTLSLASNTPACAGNNFNLYCNTGSMANISINSDDTLIAKTVSYTLRAIAAGNATITYTATNGCGSNTATAVVTVNQQPAAIAGESNVCVGNTITLTNAVSGGKWYNYDDHIAIDSISGIVTGQISGYGYAFAYYQTNGGCFVSKAINVSRTFMPGITGSAGVCAGSSTTLADIVSGGRWLSSNTSVLTIDSITGVASGMLSGNATITYQMSGGCYTYINMTVDTLNILPITGDSIVCVNSFILLCTATPRGGTWSSQNSHVSGGSWVHSDCGGFGGVSSGVGIAKLTVTNSCGTISATKNITVNPIPLPFSGPVSTCIGSSISLSEGMAGGIWSSSNTSVATIDNSGNVLGKAAGTSAISYTLPSGCYRITNYTIGGTIPTGISGTGEICIGSTGTLSDGIGGGTWASSNTSIVTTTTLYSGVSTIAGVNPGTATITYNYQGCPVTKAVTVDANPLSAISGPAAICSGSSATLSNTITGGTWNCSSPAVATVGISSGLVTGVSYGYPVITYQLTSGCSRTFNLKVDAPLPSLGNDTTICGNYTVHGMLPFCSYNGWQFGGGIWTSTNTDVVGVNSYYPYDAFYGRNAGTATISYTLNNGCGTNSVTKNITVNQAPANLVTLGLGSGYICVGDTITMTNSISGGKWSSGNPSWVSIDSITGLVNGIAASNDVPIYYTLSNGCFVGSGVSVNSTFPVLLGASEICVGNFDSLGFYTYRYGSGQWNWTSSNPSVATVTLDYNGNTQEVYNGLVTGISPGIATITYNYNGCKVTKTITVDANPLDTITGPTAVCNGSTITLSDATTGGNWSVNNSSLATVDSLTGAVTGSLRGTTTITYKLGSNCYKTKEISVENLPLPITTSDSVITVGNTNELGVWTSGGGGIWSSSNSLIDSILERYVGGVGNLWVYSSSRTKGLAAGTATISYTLTNGCGTNSVTKQITVNPALPIVAGPRAVCVGNTISLSSNVTGGIWFTDYTARISVDSNTGTITGLTAGTAIVTYFLSDNYYQTVSINIGSVYPSTISGSTTLCTGNASTLSDAVTGGSWTSSATGVVTVGSANGVVSGVNAGVATVTYSKAGCAVVQPVTVNPNPLAANTGPTAVCLGNTITLANTTTGGTWTSSNTGLATVGAGTGVVSSVAVGVSVISYALSSGCYKTTTVTVNNTYPTSISGTSELCAGNTVTLSNGTSPGTWSSGTTSVATVGGTGVVTGITAGTANITYTVLGCSVNKAITIDANPLALITGPTAVCLGNTITLANTTTGGTWTSSNTNSATVGAGTGVVSSVAVGVSVISYALGSGCYRTTSVTVNNTYPSSISGTSELCAGNTVTLTDATTGGTWLSGTTSVATVGGTGVVTGITAGTANITYTKLGCSVTKAVTINTNPLALNTGPTAVCLGNTITLTNATTGGTWTSSNTGLATVGAGTGVVSSVAVGVPVISYALSSGCYRTTLVTVNNTYPSSISGTSELCVGNSATLTDATTGGTWLSGTTSVATVGGTGVVTGITAGTANITYTKLGCSVTKAVTIDTNPLTLNTGPTAVCLGNTITLTNTTTGGTWTSSNTGLATVGAGTGVVSSVAAGVPVISYALSSGCYRTTLVTVNNTYPSSISGTSVLCAGSTVTLTNATTGGTWLSGTTSVATVGGTGVVTGITAGTANISYTKLGCSVTKVVTINTNPLALNTGPTAVCLGNTITLANATTGGTWTSSNTNSATVGAGTGVVSSVAVGVPVISYALSSGCYRTTSVTVNNTYPSSIAGTAELCVGNSVTLSDATTGGTWLSGTTSVATVGGTGVVTGITAGTANITYTKLGCSVTKAVTIDTNPLALNTGPTAVCLGNTITLANTTTGGTWTSSNTGLATVGAGTGIVSSVAVGIPVISYALSSGCYRTTSVTVNNTYPSSIAGTSELCVGNSATLTDATTGGTWLSGTTSVTTVGGTGVVTGITAGTANITYTKLGCSVTKAVTIDTNPLALITGPTAVCLGNTITLANATTGGTWTSSNTGLATVGAGTGIVSSVAVGVPVISYALSSGCYRTTYVSVKAVPSAISGTNAICTSTPVTLAETSTAGIWSSSSIAKATITTGGVVTGVSAGVANISYTVSGCTPVVFPITVSVCRIGENGGYVENANEHVNIYSFYPNPSDGNVTISQSIAKDETVSVKVINSVGQTIYDGSMAFAGGTGALNLSGNVSGVYLLLFADSKGQKQSFRLVIEK